MVNISSEKYSLEDVKDYVKNCSHSPYIDNNLESVSVNSKDFYNGTSRDYPFCHSIKHPETGETLRPVKGYMGQNERGNDRCYYAEYADSKGNPYSYIFQFSIYDKDGNLIVPKKTIERQMFEDNQLLQQTIKKLNGNGELGEN